MFLNPVEGFLFTSGSEHRRSRSRQSVSVKFLNKLVLNPSEFKMAAVSINTQETKSCEEEVTTGRGTELIQSFLFEKDTQGFVPSVKGLRVFLMSE